jgi:hypothetical protein
VTKSDGDGDGGKPFDSGIIHKIDGGIPSDADTGTDGEADVGGDGGEVGGTCGDLLPIVDLNREGWPVEGGYGYDGTIEGGRSLLAGRCGPAGEASGAEAVLLFTPRYRGDLLLDTWGSSFDTILSVRTDCLKEASQLGCNDDVLGSSGVSVSELVVPDVEPGRPLVLIIDGVEGDDVGQYRLVVRVRPQHMLGERCQPGGGVRDCGGNLACIDGRCVEGDPPEAIRGAFTDIGGGLARLEVEGRDEGADVVWTAVTLRHATTGREQHFRLRIDDSVVMEREFRVVHEIPCETEQRSATVTFVDNAGLTSEPLVLPRIVPTSLR